MESKVEYNGDELSKFDILLNDEWFGIPDTTILENLVGTAIMYKLVVRPKDVDSVISSGYRATMNIELDTDNNSGEIHISHDTFDGYSFESEAQVVELCNSLFGAVEEKLLGGSA